jgi:predicted amidohydrolase
VKIAIAQMEMRPTRAGNMAGVIDHLHQAKALDAEVAVFPECATTGFHRHVPEQVNRRDIADAIARIQKECAALRIAAVVGTPYYPSASDSGIWNAAVVVDGSGEIVAVVPKVGLTKTERLFFAAGATRPAFSLGSVGCGVMLCREVRDGEEIRGQLGGARLMFWLGAIAWDSEPADPENVVTPEIASTCARTLESYVVQCNWASSVNDAAVAGMGGSLVIAPTGDVLHRCPLDTPGISIVEIEPVAPAG